MNKKILSIFLCFGLFLSTGSFVKANQVNTYIIHVAPNGLDTATGSETAPLASLDGARRTVRRLKRIYGSELPVTVIFHEGTYRFNSTVNFTEEDTGSINGPIVYKAAEGEKVKFSGAIDIDISKLRKVTDRAILSRLPKTSRDIVGYLDLKEQGIDVNLIPKIPSNCTAGDMVSNEANFNDVSFILDGDKQPISQWPNGRYEYATFEGVSQGSAAENKGGSFRYSESEPMRWLEAKDMYLYGFFDYDYVSKRYKVGSIDKENKVITLKYGTVGSIQSKRWKALHLLEEIDTPGEWYLDRDSYVLYYYPRYNLSNSKMEMSVFAGNMISLDSTSNGPDYITFDGFCFENSRGGGIMGKHNSNNITIRNCDFNGIDGYGIYIRGDIGQNIRMGDYDEWGAFASYTRRGCKDWLIEDNKFVNCGTTPISVCGGGDAFIHEFSNNVIRNNYFTQNALDNTTAHCIDITSGVGTIVKNNLIHNQSHHGIDDDGQESKIMYNEVSNVIKSTMDSGAIYSGRSILRRGSEIAYNFVKDTKHQIPGQTQHNRAIYFDDEISGQYVHHNICVDGDKSITFGGSSGQVYSNISVDMETGYSLKPYGAMWEKNQQKKYDNWINAVERGMDAPVWDLYNKIYPGILKEYNYYQNTGTIEFLYNTISNNLSVNSGEKELSSDDFTASRGGVSFNNTTAPDKSCFVDPDNYDYRVKKSSDVYKNNNTLLSEDFDLNSIGLDIDEFGGKDRILNNKEFKLLYPQNNAGGIERTNLSFCWQRSMGADKYHFELSTDPNFESKIIDTYTYDNTYTVSELTENSKQYYWRVNAINELKDFHDTWESASGVCTFKTSATDIITFDSLKMTVLNVTKAVDDIVEGDKPGMYKAGTIDNIHTYLDKAKNILEAPEGTYSQVQINAFENELANSIDTSIWQNPGFVNLGDYITDESAWNAYYQPALTVSENGVSLFSEQNSFDQVANASLKNVSKMSKSVLFAFKLKCDFAGDGDKNWMGIGVRGNKDQLIYTQYNYFFAIKQHLLEYQIRSSGLTGIIDTKENTFIKNGQWHDIIFGAYDCGFGQITVLLVDGNVVFYFLDDTAYQLRNEGCFTIYASPYNTINIAPYEGDLDLDFEDLVKDFKYNACIARGAELAGYVDGNITSIHSVGSNLYYNQNTIKDNGTATVVLGEDNEILVSSTMLSRTHGIDVSEEYISANNLLANYGISTYKLGDTVILSDTADFYMYNGTIPYAMNVFSKELLSIEVSK